MAYAVHIFLRPAMGAVPQCVHGNVDFMFLSVHVPEPRLEFWRGDLLGARDALDSGAVSLVHQYNRNAVFGIEVVSDVVRCGPALHIRTLHPRYILSQSRTG